MKDDYLTLSDKQMIEFNLPLDTVIRPLKLKNKETYIMNGIISLNQGGNWFSGGVNIGNRIFTDGVVTKLGDGKFKICPKGTEPINAEMASFLARFGSMSTPPSKQKSVTAEIDGIEYSGKEILFDNGCVTVVDGESSDFSISQAPK